MVSCLPAKNSVWFHACPQSRPKPGESFSSLCDSLLGVPRIPCTFKHIKKDRNLCTVQKLAALILDSLMSTSKGGDDHWNSVPLGNKKTKQNTEAKQKLQFLFPFSPIFENTTLVSVPRVLNEPHRARLWCDNHFQVNLSSVTSAQGI